jgi:benzoylformate decarboxylase
MSVTVATSVRDATFDLFRRRGLTTLFANPGSTEVPFLVGLPDDLRFVLGLHEGSVIGLATGFAIGTGQPALALLHTTAGLGNAVAAIATARVNHAPLVIAVGQQDRRHLAYEPFLAGKLDGLAGSYPVRVEQPARGQDVPSAIERAFHAAETSRGPAIVIIPMDDWTAEADDEREPAAVTGPVLRATGVDRETIAPLARLLDEAESPALVVGAGADQAETWDALVDLAERLSAPVFQEPFGGRSGFPGDHPHFQGVLPAQRPQLRERLAPYDAVLVVGAPAFRQAGYAPGRFTLEDTRVAVLGDDPDEVHRSAAELAVLAPLPAACRALADLVTLRDSPPPEPVEWPTTPAPPAPGEQLTAGHVMAALADRLPRDAVVIEEAPVDRPELNARLRAYEPLGNLSAAQGGLGFALPGATGLRMALPERPVVAVTGDGAALYCVQALWTAARYDVGAVYVVLANGGYRVMDRIAEQHGGGSWPWPSFGEVRLSALAEAFGCPAQRISTLDELSASLDELVPTLRTRTQPLLLDVEVSPTATFNY